jgi:hypothetical protein
VGVLQHDVDIVIVLALHADDSSDHPKHLPFLLTNAMIRSRTAVSRHVVEGTDGRVERGVELYPAGVAIAKALHVGAANGASRSDRRTYDNSGKVDRGPRVDKRGLESELIDRAHWLERRPYTTAAPPGTAATVPRV